LSLREPWCFFPEKRRDKRQGLVEILSTIDEIASGWNPVKTTGQASIQTEAMTKQMDFKNTVTGTNY
jgi:hypothetical protein